VWQEKVKGWADVVTRIMVIGQVKKTYFILLDDVDIIVLLCKKVVLRCNRKVLLYKKFVLLHKEKGGNNSRTGLEMTRNG